MNASLEKHQAPVQMKPISVDIGRAIPTSHFVVPVQKDQPQIIGLEAGCSRGEGSGNAKFSFDYGKISVCTFFSHCRSSDVTSENSSFRMSRYCCGVF